MTDYAGLIAELEELARHEELGVKTCARAASALRELTEWRPIDDEARNGDFHVIYDEAAKCPLFARFNGTVWHRYGSVFGSQIPKMYFPLPTPPKDAE